MHKTFTMHSHTDGNISSALLSIIFGTLFARDRRMLCKPTTRFSHIMFRGLQSNPLCTNPSDTASCSNKCTSIWLGIVAHVRKFTNYDRVQTHSCGILGSHSKALWILPPYEALCSPRDCHLNFEGRYFARFERTCCFRKVGNRLQGYTVLHHGKSTPSLQIYIPQPQKGERALKG
jgi:hypothetical protein